MIENPTNTRVLSIASLWEMAIKVSMGRLMFATSFEQVIPDQLQRNRIQILDMTFVHVTEVSRLSFHHRDPFDRMIIAQALSENLPIISIYPVFDHYPITRLWS